MLEYIAAVKRGFRDTHGFKPTDGPEVSPVFGEGQIPDGEYPMVINGRVDHVQLVGGMIHCTRFEECGKPACRCNTKAMG